MLQQGLEQVQGAEVYVDRDAAIAPPGWPGYSLKLPRAPSLSTEVPLVPSSFWHMDLSEASLSRNTFLHPTTRCRFPTRVFYLDALINCIVESTLNPGHNRCIHGYLFTQYHYFVDWLTAFFPDTFPQLSPGNMFFVDLYDIPLPPGTRRRVCSNRQRIQLGQLTVEDAWQSMPMKFINTVRTIEAERQDKMRLENIARAKIGETTPQYLSIT
ncbi:hypothetical protein P168DRAFT_146281 [Aspergillus campestris IBT 28561]|uniref:Uncharacterized protein n=1 Tax=Aspergillus campestris (strain IBT 28561) TaxID=1392248 RepID=A0A2I1D5I1_ASPC2|nr:uncharacterized protein P168DRAFT_146281 [Aspergillus campestris IBT 28561]PKY05131.1 hypothetical protein P168DRAFT_146281 [Aspergillus campestris IBT 28561]